MQRPTSPRSQLSSLLLGKLGVPEDSLDAVMAEAQEKLTASDAENKLHNRKLYLVRWHTVRRWTARSVWGRARSHLLSVHSAWQVIDLDETLVYSKRLEPGATPVGSLIYVRGQPFDMQPRPGLQHFLQMAASSYIVFLYTMGDADYVHAVMNVIDPERQYFRGARPPQPRHASPALTVAPSRPRPRTPRRCGRWHVLLAADREPPEQEPRARAHGEAHDARRGRLDRRMGRRSPELVPDAPLCG